MRRAWRHPNREDLSLIPRSPGGLGVVDCEDRDLVLDRRGVAVRVGQCCGEAFGRASRLGVHGLSWRMILGASWRTEV